jgi:hypothetical protein
LFQSAFFGVVAGVCLVDKIIQQVPPFWVVLVTYSRAANSSLAFCLPPGSFQLKEKGNVLFVRVGVCWGVAILHSAIIGQIIPIKSNNSWFVPIMLHYVT